MKEFIRIVKRPLRFRENGISMSDHYSVRKEVDLALMAERNGLTMSENGGLLVEGRDKSADIWYV